uniref:Uncharacterized protein n=1 Tax=Amphilophus citrinellus TaxID=61819 RepID=A0A3Q0RE00_AMPCI
MESEGAFSGAGWHATDGEGDRQDSNSSSATSFPGRGPPESLVSATTHTSNTAEHVRFSIMPGTNQGVAGAHSAHIQVPVSMLEPAVPDKRDREMESDLERQEKLRKLEQERAVEEERERALVLEQERERALEREKFERQQALEKEEREKALQREKELALEKERQEREQALAKEREEQMQALAREKALELERQAELQRQKLLEQERLQKEREEREKREKEEMERQERIEREKAIELERMERERALELERIERERAVELERLERERALELERIERENALELERMKLERARKEKERALEQERQKALERERLENERAMQKEREEQERKLEQEKDKNRLAEKESESHLSPSKCGLEVGLTSLPTPHPLSTGPAINSSTEAEDQEQVHAPEHLSEAQAAKSGAATSPASLSSHSSFKKFRFLRDPAQAQSLSTSMVIKRPRTFSDGPQPLAPLVTSPTSVGKGQLGQGPSLKQEDSEIWTNQQVAAGPPGSVGIQSEEELAVSTAVVPKEERATRLVSENKEQAASGKTEKAAKESTQKPKDVDESKGLTSSVGGAQQRGRDSKKEGKRTRQGSSSNDSSSSESDSESSSSRSSGSSSSSQEKNNSSRVKRVSGL